MDLAGGRAETEKQLHWGDPPTSGLVRKDWTSGRMYAAQPSGRTSATAGGTSSASRLKSLQAALTSFEPDGPSIREHLAEELRALLSADRAGSFELAVSAEGVGLERAHVVGVDRALLRTALGEALAQAPEAVLLFDAREPQAWQRNQALRLEELSHQQPLPARLSLLLQRVGLQGEDMLRVLICEGSTVLAWVGAFRKKPFGERERELLQQLVPALCRRFQLERELAASALHATAFAAALEVLSTPAFLVTVHGHVRHANAQGQKLLEEAPEDVRAGLCHSEGRSPAGRTFRLTALPGVSAGGHRLAVLVAQVQGPEARLRESACRWGLTPRQTEVLGQLVRGLSNKEIAQALGCSTSTIEVHLTALLRKADAQSRSELVARFWGPREG